MRKYNQEITDPVILEEILTKSAICRIAMADKDVPYLLPFNYGYKANCIYIHTSAEGKKIDLLKQHGKVSFEIEQKAEIVEHEKACSWATAYRSVIGTGFVEIITDSIEKRKGLDIIMSHNGASGELEYDDKQVNAIVILKLKISEKTGKQSRNWDKVHTFPDFNIDTERLLLKEISWDDLEQIHDLHSIPEVDEFNTLGIPASIEETKRIIQPLIEAKTLKPRGSYTWKIILKGTGNFIGMAGYSLSNNRFKLGEIYYKFSPKYWGKGYATEVARRLIKLGFEDFKLHKVEAGVASANVKSIKVLEKAGMLQEGLRRKILPIRGTWVDNYHYAICEDDPRDY